MIRIVVVSALSCLPQMGCTRAHYRENADRDAYRALGEKMTDRRWQIPSVSIDASPQARFFDPFDPDHPPMPSDDLAAHCYMKRNRGTGGQGDGIPIESIEWRKSLELSKDGELLLTTDSAMRLALINSREYQFQLENLYLVAIDLTLERFKFDLHWFGGTATTFEHSAIASANESKTLTVPSTLGVTRVFSSGAQLLVDFANAFTWQFAGPTSYRTASSNIVLDLAQPLLRGAGRNVVLEPLTQAEREVLYAVRDFARFRNQFYFDVTTGSTGFLSLVLQLQNIRNLEANVASLKQNLRLHEALLDTGVVSRIQVDQVFQSYQQGQLGLLQAQTTYLTSLDNFKSTLGLPPDIPIQLDDSLLAPFQLQDPVLVALQEDIDQFLDAYRELDDAPSLAPLIGEFNKLKTFHNRLGRLMNQVYQELASWKTQIDHPQGEDQQDRAARERSDHEQLVKRLAELHEELRDLGRTMEEASRPDSHSRSEAWEAVQRLARHEQAVVGELFVIQTQVRVCLINLKPVQFELAGATAFALANRLDLMNQRARVVDAWRQIDVAANGLEAGLGFVFHAGTGTDPGTNPFKFSAAASSYSVGLKFDAPLDRMAERNIYRKSLVNYERARRAYMALEDQVQASIRRDLRQLNTDRLNFEIARQSIIVAARQVDLTRDQLLLADNPGDSSGTLDMLNALNALLQAKNALISTWVNYETERQLLLLLDLEAVQPDWGGV